MSTMAHWAYWRSNASDGDDGGDDANDDGADDVDNDVDHVIVK